MKTIPSPPWTSGTFGVRRPLRDRRCPRRGPCRCRLSGPADTPGGAVSRRWRRRQPRADDHATRRRSWASRSSSTIARARAATSAPRSSRARARTATRCSTAPTARMRSTRASTPSCRSTRSRTSRRCSQMTQIAAMLIVNPAFPAETVGALIAYAKAHPGVVELRVRRQRHNLGIWPAYCSRR